jgi:hypothetical protein
MAHHERLERVDREGWVFGAEFWYSKMSTMAYSHLSMKLCSTIDHVPTMLASLTALIDAQF